MRDISAADVHRLLDYPALIAGLDDAHRGAMPLVERSYLQPDGAREGLLVWSAVVPGKVMGVKVVTVFPDNTASSPPRPTIQAVVTLFDGVDGRQLATIDGAALTGWKTAADSALGAKYLAPADAQVLLMVGAGSMARHLIAAHRAVRPSIDTVLVWNRTTERARDLVAELADDCISVTEDLEAAARSADVISCATGSALPLINGAWLQPGCHLDLVGGFTPDMREADDDAIRRASVFVDTRWFTLKDAGDICQPIEAGILAEGDIKGDLFDLARGTAQGRQSGDEITLFKNAGGGHLDLFCASILYDASRSDSPDLA